MPKKTITADVRHPYYEAGDKIIGIGHAIAEEPAMAGDTKLAEIHKRLKAVHDELYAHLQANYLWD